MKKKIIFIFFTILVLMITLIVLVNGYSKKDEIKVLENSQDVIWSGTFQLAWNELIESCGTKVEFNDDISFVRTLNDKWFTKDMIDKNDYYIMVSETNFELKNKIKKDIKQKFKRNDNNIINKICDVSNISKDVNVIEIGPGLGTLTKYLLEKGYTYEEMTLSGTVDNKNGKYYDSA